MKACENCRPNYEEIARVQIGKQHCQVSFARQFFGVWLIYFPVITLPFVIFSAYLTYWHLCLMGAKNLKPLSEFLPSRKSYRYTMKTQITMQPGYKLSPTQSKLFWIFNCTWFAHLVSGCLSGMPIWLKWWRTGGVHSAMI